MTIMLTESTVLLVWTSQSPELLAEQLELHEVFVESTPLEDVERTLPVVGPDLLVHLGREGVERVVALLADQTSARRVRLALVAPRASLEELRKLDRSLVLSVLPDDLPQKMLVERIVQLARRSGGAALATASPRPAVPRPGGLPRPVPAPGPAPVARAAGNALSGASAKRVALIDDDVTRADVVGAALRERGFSLLLLPTDTGRVRWPHLRRFAPQVLVTDGADRPPYGWLELLRTDAELSAVRLVTVPYRQLFAESTGIATLEPLLDRIVHLGLPGSNGGSDDEDDRPTLIADDDRPTLVATDEQHAALEASAAETTEQHVASAETAPPGEDERSSAERISLEDIESILPEPSESDRPSEELPTVPFGLPTQELLAAARASQSFKVEPLPPAGASDAETPEVPQSQDVDSLLDSLERASLEAAGAGTSTEAPVSVSPASLVEGRVASGHEPSSDSSGASTPSDVAAVDALESNAAFAITAVKDATEIGGSRTSALAPVLAPAQKKKRGSAGRWLGLGAALVLLGAGGFWMRQRSLSVAPSSVAVAQEVATSGAAPEKSPSESAAAPTPPPANGSASTKSEIAAAEPGVSQAPWRIAEKTELTRCERQVGDYAALPETDIEQASRSWEKARSALLLGDLEKARDLMCRAVLMHPESLALEGLAETYLTLGSPEQAKLWVDAAIRLRPDRSKTRELLGDIENQRGRVDESRDIWVKTFSLAPNDQKTLDWLAKKLVGEAQGALRAGSTHRTEILYRRAATLSSSNADAPAGLARLALKAGNHEQAARWVAVALDRSAGHSDALVVQGDLALARGDSESARQSYLRALEKNAFNRGALEQLARLDRK